MTMNLVSTSGARINFTVNAWYALVEMGKENGWKPERDDYMANDGQTVTAEDARAWAYSLSKVVQAHPTDEIMEAYVEKIGPSPMMVVMEKMGFGTMFTFGNARQEISAFISFALRGSFKIF